jgi:hypothetical protein
MAANLLLIKFLGGEEIIAEALTESFGTTINVKNPVRIVVIPDQPNPKTPQVGLAPYLQFSDDKEISINRSLVVTTAKPLPDFVNQYNSLFGGIQIPTSSIITP